MPIAGFCLLKSFRGKGVENYTHISNVYVLLTARLVLGQQIKPYGEKNRDTERGERERESESEKHRGDRKYLSPSSFNHDAAAARGYPNNWFSVMKTTDARRIICDGT